MANKKVKKKAPPTKKASARKAPVRKKAPAKKAPAKRAPAKKAPAKKGPPPKRAIALQPGTKPVRRRDGGHIDPKYANELLAKGGTKEREPKSFIEGSRSNDDLAEELGEEFVEEVTSAEHEGEDLLNQDVPEDDGGPFVETRAEEEFAHGTDPSNPKGAKREPFPTT
jgi:hypothetical protein